MSMPAILEKYLKKAIRYCAYQERCFFDIEKHMAKWPINAADKKTILDHLKEENYVNDQRFSTIFATSKLRNNYWGKIKIQYELSARKIDSHFVQKAIEVIDEAEYHNILKKLIEKKSIEFSNISPEKKKKKSYGIF